ncbi:MAG: PLP-dependent transferase [Candidatus Saganbacteria bacterium]|nr:PLP-dependent transferase [Candidatus Saganbacteria bacterium]
MGGTGRVVTPGRIDIPAAEVRRFGLGHIIKVARQEAINRVIGPQAHWYPGSMPFCTESAFEFLEVEQRVAEAAQRQGATEVGADAFANFSLPDGELGHHYIYQRLDGPNDTALKRTIAKALSIINYGKNILAVVFNNGMSGFTAMFRLLRPGDILFYHPVCYGCTKNEIVSGLPLLGIKTQPEKFENLSTFRHALLTTKKARMVFLETELNPLMHIPPLEEIGAMIEEVNAKRIAKGWRPIIVFVDNTFPTFANMNPLGIPGIHIELESMTKFVAGDGENMGCFVAIDADHDFRLGPEDYGTLYQALMMRQKDLGLSMSPFPAWDLLRRLPSMEMRRSWVQANAQKVAEFLKHHPKVASVNYPGMMEDNAQNDRAHRLMVDEQGNFAPGYLVYFVLKGEGEEAKENARKLLNWLSVNTSIRVKVSFGQQETLIEVPSLMTHSSYSLNELLAADIDPGGIRLAMGWEDASYVMYALEEGLKQI